MAWVKIPPEHHALIRAAFPRDPLVSTITMFGGVVAMVKGNMLGGNFGRGAFVRLAPKHVEAAMRLDGAEFFDPMNRGVGFRDMVFLPEPIYDEPDELRAWFEKALAYTRTLPVKKKAPRNPETKKTSAKKRR